MLLYPEDRAAGMMTLEIAALVETDTVADAVKCLADANGGAKILAGGTDLLVQLRAGRLAADTIVDIKHIPEVRAITAEDGGFRVGAAVSGAELGEHPDVRRAWPGVVEALELIGSAQIQSRASLGGNLCNGSPAADSVPATGTPKIPQATITRSATTRMRRGAAMANRAMRCNIGDPLLVTSAGYRR